MNNGGMQSWLGRAAWALVAAVAVPLAVYWNKPVIEDERRMQEQNSDLERRIAKEQQTAAELDSQLKMFQNPLLEKTLVERLAREKLSYAKPGENIVHFEPAVTGPLGH